MRVRGLSFSIETTALTRDFTSDSRLIEIAHITEYPHQRPSEEGAIESAVDEHDAGAGTTAHGHTGGLLFVQESELDNEADVPAVGDVPPTDSAAPYEEEPEPEPELEHKPTEVAEPVGTLASSTRQLLI